MNSNSCSCRAMSLGGKDDFSFINRAGEKKVSNSSYRFEVVKRHNGASSYLNVLFQTNEHQKCDKGNRKTMIKMKNEEKKVGVVLCMNVAHLQLTFASNSGVCSYLTVEF